MAHLSGMRLDHTYAVFYPNTIVHLNNTPRVQHPNHELCHRTDDVAQHRKSQEDSASANGMSKNEHRAVQHCRVVADKLEQIAEIFGSPAVVVKRRQT
jgi:hypothetical protein